MIALQTGWVHFVRRGIADIVRDILQAAGKPNRILAHPAAGVRVVPAGLRSIQAGHTVQPHAGIAEGHADARLTDCIAVRIEKRVPDDARNAGTGIVLRHVPNAILLVG